MEGLMEEVEVEEGVTVEESGCDGGGGVDKGSEEEVTEVVDMMEME